MVGRLPGLVAGERCARQQAEGIRHLRRVTVMELIVAQGMATCLQRGIEIGRDAGEPFGSQGFVTGLFERVEQRPGVGVDRRVALMQPAVVMAQPQGQTVGLAAELLDFGVSQCARWIG